MTSYYLNQLWPSLLQYKCVTRPPWFYIMTSSNRNIFRVTGPLCEEFIGNRWIPLTKVSDWELWCFIWSASWINGWVNNREADDLRRHRAHCDVIVMTQRNWTWLFNSNTKQLLSTRNSRWARSTNLLNRHHYVHGFVLVSMICLPKIP